MPNPNTSIPAAQYLRMSTEHQQYSIENQSAAIKQYADLHNIEIVQTYLDTARSGVVLRHRVGLQKLLQDVVRGGCAYERILVYDVSRWGRFQDTDEAAHYEFVCKSAGVPVHYCAEAFTNDGSLPSLVMKALKRTMAGEYSRELGNKVLAGQKRLARLGFKQGGRPGYGLRRLLVGPSRAPKQELAAGERKSIATDRVVLVPGPREEVECVREIFRLLIEERRTVHAIARELNRRRIEYTPESKWDYQAVIGILVHPKYSGCHVFGRTASRLYTPPVRIPRDQWVLTPGAFEPIVEPHVFERAQEILRVRTHNKTNAEVLDELRSLLLREGRITLRTIKRSHETPSPSTYRKRFGSLRRAYELIGYGRPEQFGMIDMRRRTLALRELLIARIIRESDGRIAVIRPSGRWRSRLRMPNRRMVSVQILRAVRVWGNTVRWVVDAHPTERKFVTLVARLNAENDAFLDFHLFPRIEKRRRFWVAARDPWFKSGRQIGELSKLGDIVSILTERQRRQ